MRYQYRQQMGTIKVFDDKENVVASFADARAFGVFSMGVSASKVDELFDLDSGRLIVGPIGEMI